MMQNPPQQPQQPQRAPSIDRKQAEVLARLFNTVFTNTHFYNALHPTTQRSVAELLFHLQRIFDKTPMVSLLLERESLYVEEWNVDARINAKKMIAHFKKIGLQSLTFLPGIQLDTINFFLSVLEKTGQANDNERLDQALKNNHIDNLRINYVVYKKVTADEEVIGKDALSQTGSHPAPASEAQVAALDAVGSLLAAQDIFSAPAAAPPQQGPAPGTVDLHTKTGRHVALNRLRDLSGKISDTQNAPHFASADEMMQVVFQLTSELRQQLDLRRQMGQAGDQEAQIVNELQELTYQTIVRLAREEYRRGQVSVQRLSQLIKRMVPESKDLKHLLPRLKDGLTAEGMPLADFLSLVKELNRELENENIVGLLDQAGEAMGVTAAEIIKGIKDNPADAARLIVLASEIRQGATTNDAQLSSLLTAYIERASGQMLLQSNAGGRKNHDAPMDQILGSIQRQLIDKLKGQGVPAGMIDRVQQHMSGRLNQTVGMLKSDWLVEYIATDPNLSLPDIQRILESVVENEVDLQRLREPLRQVLLQKGFSDEQIADLLQQTKKYQRTPKQGLPALPKGVLTSNNALFFLKHSIGLAKRYHTPFSTIMITVPAAQTRNAWNKLTPQESSVLMPEIFSSLTAMLRELDLVGSLTTLDVHIPFVLLPMTPLQGALVVQGRIAEHLGRMQFSSGNDPVRIAAAISVTAFDEAIPADLMEYLKQAKARHKAEEDRIRKEIGLA